MTKFSGALDDNGSNGNTNLLELEKEDTYISGDGIYTFNKKDLTYRLRI